MKTSMSPLSSGSTACTRLAPRRPARPRFLGRQAHHLHVTGLGLSAPSAGGAPAVPAGRGSLEVRLAEREVLVAGREIELTRREFDLLAYLVARPREVVTREQLLAQVWGSSTDWQDPATVTEHVRRVRGKIDPAGRAPRWITTVRGVGYRFEPDGESLPQA